MLKAFGWVVVRTSRACYTEPVSIEDIIDTLDDEVDVRDHQLWADLLAWLSSEADIHLKWQFFEALNNEQGILQFCTSKNHRGGSTMWDLMDWIVKHGDGSYGLVYVHDDEDGGHDSPYFGRGRAEPDFSNVFRVWRILPGKLEELDDPFLSPIVPMINPSHYA